MWYQTREKENECFRSALANTYFSLGDEVTALRAYRQIRGPVNQVLLPWHVQTTTNHLYQGILYTRMTLEQLQRLAAKSVSTSIVMRDYYNGNIVLLDKEQTIPSIFPSILLTLRKKEMGHCVHALCQTDLETVIDNGIEGVFKNEPQIGRLVITRL